MRRSLWRPRCRRKRTCCLRTRTTLHLRQAAQVDCRSRAPELAQSPQVPLSVWGRLIPRENGDACMLAPLLRREVEDRQLACTRGNTPRRDLKGQRGCRQVRGPSAVGLAVVRGLPGARSLPSAARRKAPRAKEEYPSEFIAVSGWPQFADATQLPACLHARQAIERDPRQVQSQLSRPAFGTKFKEEYAGV